jgi:hypothetical protein
MVAVGIRYLFCLKISKSESAKHQVHSNQYANLKSEMKPLDHEETNRMTIDNLTTWVGTEVFETEQMKALKDGEDRRPARELSPSGSAQTRRRSPSSVRATA